MFPDELEVGFHPILGSAKRNIVCKMFLEGKEYLIRILIMMNECLEVDINVSNIKKTLPYNGGTRIECLDYDRFKRLRFAIDTEYNTYETSHETPYILISVDSVRNSDRVTIVPGLKDFYRDLLPEVVKLYRQLIAEGVATEIGFSEFFKDFRRLKENINEMYRILEDKITDDEKLIFEVKYGGSD